MSDGFNESFIYFFWLSLLLLILIFLFYLKITLISPKTFIKKIWWKPISFFVKNDKCKLISFPNGVGFNFSGGIDMLKGDDGFRKNNIL